MRVIYVYPEMDSHLRLNDNPETESVLLNNYNRFLIEQRKVIGFKYPSVGNLFSNINAIKYLPNIDKMVTIDYLVNNPSEFSRDVILVWDMNWTRNIISNYELEYLDIRYINSKMLLKRENEYNKSHYPQFLNGMNSVQWRNYCRGYYQDNKWTKCPFCRSIPKNGNIMRSYIRPEDDGLYYVGNPCFFPIASDIERLPNNSVVQTTPNYALNTLSIDKVKYAEVGFDVLSYRNIYNMSIKCNVSQQMDLMKSPHSEKVIPNLIFGIYDFTEMRKTHFDSLLKRFELIIENFQLPNVFFLDTGLGNGEDCLPNQSEYRLINNNINGDKSRHWNYELFKSFIEVVERNYEINLMEE